MKISRNIPLEHLAEMFQTLKILDLAGVTLEDALLTLEQSWPASRVQSTLQRIQQGLRAGILLSEALALQPGVFQAFIIQIIATGEKTGKFAPCFQEIENHLLWQIRLQNTVSKDLRYGAIMLALITGMILGVSTFLLPQIKGLLLSLGITTLPLATQALVYFGQIVASASFAIITTAPILALMVAFFRPAFLRHIPGLGPILIESNLTYFLKTLAALLQARIDLMPALEQARAVITFPYLHKHLASIPLKIAAGTTLCEALQAQPQFSPLILRLVRLGESTGRLADLLGQAASLQQQQYAKRVERLVQRLHPTLVITLGILILWVVLATLLPLYNTLAVG